MANVQWMRFVDVFKAHMQQETFFDLFREVQFAYMIKTKQYRKIKGW